MLRRLSVDQMCKAAYTCPSVWEDDTDPEYLVVVGHQVPNETVPMAEGEIAIRIKRQVVADAKIG
ncbi:hypothetical protein GCM10010174_81000 [Kutzneria viridogrisea]|uniref:Uncharacterized protein n=1 Tax=Kutzneria viridogrisea TaxID=47990 RepID=A0ABR6BZ31_9PSEU|nr:hypothetical protein [Kutzneria viridogrisea]